MAELKYWLWLTSRRGMDSVRALKLLERFVTPEQVYYADVADIAELGLSPQSGAEPGRQEHGRPGGHSGGV